LTSSHPEYLIISPVRNEAEHLPKTIRSVLTQTVKPARWIIVDDGSTDDTASIAEEASRSHSWIKVVRRSDRGFRKAGGGVVDAFYEGYSAYGDIAWDFLAKLDGDVEFSPDYFERCFACFRTNELLGIAGGTVCLIAADGSLKEESKVDPKFHVRGATKIYRKLCWEAIGGLLRSPGWDTMDEIKANMLGWQTYTIPGLNVIHHRPTGAAYGAWSDRVKNGLGCYIVGYHPIFMFLKGISRFHKKPYILGGCGLLFGFLKGYLTGVHQIDDKVLIRYFRKQQMNRLCFRKSLWD
jgi:poly-beta-1,6-N-acetyl-D-glucosamine synthase